MGESVGLGVEVRELAELLDLVVAAARFAEVVAGLLAEHCVLVSWIVYWIWFAPWPRIRGWLRQGAWVSAVLLYGIVALAWALASESQWGWPNLVEKLLICGLWVGIAFVCGAIQDYLRYAPPEIEITGPPDVGQAPAASHASHHH